MNTIVGPKISYGQGHELLQCLEKAGMDTLDAQRVIQSPGNELAKDMVELIKLEPCRDTPSQKRAREIMGKNFYGRMELHNLFNLTHERGTDKENDAVPFSEELLRQCKDSHILFLGQPVSIAAIHEHYVDLRKFWGPSISSMVKTDSFIEHDYPWNKWYLIRKTIIEESKGMCYSSQESIISTVEEVPRACEIIFMMILAYLGNNERLFEGEYLRCRDRMQHFRLVINPDSSRGMTVWTANEDMKSPQSITTSLKASG